MGKEKSIQLDGSPLAVGSQGSKEFYPEVQLVGWPGNRSSYRIEQKLQVVDEGFLLVETRRRA